jgi:hypothetical protein
VNSQCEIRQSLHEFGLIEKQQACRVQDGELEGKNIFIHKAAVFPSAED